MTKIPRYLRASDSEYWVFLVAVTLAFGVAGCRGRTSNRSPVRVVRDMVQQPKATALSLAARSSPTLGSTDVLTGTVSIEHVDDGDAPHTGKIGDGFVKRIPVEVTESTLQHGETLFNIYCAPCHDRAGTARGLVAQRGFPNPIDLSSDNTRQRPDGEIFSIISSGVRNMPSMAEQVQPLERWNVVAWVRVLQRSQHAQTSDLGAVSLSTIRPEQVTP